MMSTDSQLRDCRFEGLDQLRGILAFSVMIYHYTEWQKVPLPWIVQLPLSLLGVYAVCTFYTLSGFALFAVYRQRTLTSAFLSEFWIKRIFRIIPLFWLVSTLAILITKEPATTWGEHLDWRTIVLNYTLLFSWLDPSAYLSTGAWSIGNEWAFYTLFPVILVASRHDAGRWIIGAVILFITAWFAFFALDSDLLLEKQWLTYINPLNQIALFAAGVMLGPTIFRKSLHKSLPIQTLAATAVFIGASYLMDITDLVTGVGRFFMITVCVICCHGFATTQLKHGLFTKSLNFLGSISYTLYLMHPLVHGLVARVIGKLQSMVGTDILGDSLRDAMVFTASVCMTLMISFLVYRFFEKPLLRFGKRLAEKRDRHLAINADHSAT